MTRIWRGGKSATYEERAEAVICNPDDLDHPIGLNLLECARSSSCGGRSPNISVFRKIFSDEDRRTPTLNAFCVMLCPNTPLTQQTPLHRLRSAQIPQRAPRQRPLKASGKIGKTNVKMAAGSPLQPLLPRYKRIELKVHHRLRRHLGSRQVPGLQFLKGLLD